MNRLPVKRILWSLAKVAALLLVVMLAGRKPAAASPPEDNPGFDNFTYLPVMGSGVEPIIPDFTKILTDDTTDLLVNVSPDGSVFTFDGVNSQLNNLEPGDIIMSDPADAAPNGFLRRVEEVYMSGGDLILETSPAALDEAIEQGQASGGKQLTPADIENMVLMPGVEMVPGRGPDGGGTFAFNLTGVLYTDQYGNEISANGNIEFTIEFDVDVALKGFSVKKVDFSSTVGEEVTIELVATSELASFEGELPIADLHLGTYTIWIGPAPVVFTLELPIALKADGSLSASITTGVTQSASFTGGIIYSRGEWDTYEYSTKEFPVFNPPEPALGLEVRGYLEPKLQLKLYGVAGPYASVEPFIKFVAATNIDPWWQLSAGIEAKVGVEIEVFGQSLGTDVELGLGYEVILAQASGGNLPPYEPSDPYPPDLADNQPLDLELSWVGGDPDGDSVTYTVYLEAEDLTPDDIACEDTLSEYCYVDNLDPDTRYYWQVHATDSEDQTTIGPTWDFKTVNQAPNPTLYCNGPGVGFESGDFPADWYYTTNADPGGEWTVSQDNSSQYWDPGPAPEGLYYASANDDLPGSSSDGSADYLYTNVFDMSGNLASATVSFWYHFNGEFGHEAGGIQGSSDGGATWGAEYILPTGADWQEVTLGLEQFIGSDQVQLRFHSDDGGEWAAGFAIDFVSVFCQFPAEMDGPAPELPQLPLEAGVGDNATAPPAMIPALKTSELKDPIFGMAD